jgi:hypothetical protein
MRPVLVIRSNPPTAVVAVGLPDDVLAVMIPKSNVYVRRANPQFSRTNVRNTGDITQTSSESPPQKLGRDLESEHGTTVVCYRKVRIALGVIRKRDALQHSLPAVGSVERGKRSDELIEKRGLGSQKHCRGGRHLAALEPKEVSLLDRRD